MSSEQQQAQNREAAAFEAHREYKCPNCGGQSYFMGIDFKAPKKRNAKAWQEVQVFIESGKTYYRGSNINS